MLDVLIGPIRKTFVYNGRATRLEYFGFPLLLFLVLCVLSAVEVSLYDDAYLATLCMFVAILPILSLSVRRLHDAGHSGAWVFVSLLITVLLLFLLPPNFHIFRPIGFLLIFGLVKKSEPGANKYGPDPHKRKEKRQKLNEQHTRSAACPSCGARQKENAKFCTSCGTALRTSDAS